LQVTDSNNCTFTDEVEISFLPPPDLTAPSEIDFCQGESASIQISSSVNSFRWFRNGELLPALTDASVIVFEGGLYTVTTNSPDGCDISANITVNERPLPVVNLGPNVALCPDSELLLNAGNAGSEYLWSTGETSQSIIVVNPGVLEQEQRQISVQVTNAFGCSEEGNVSINFFPIITVSIDAGTASICEGGSIEINASGASNYIWQGPAGTLNTTTGSMVLASPIETSIYTVLGIDDICDGNDDQASVEITVNLPLEGLTAGNDTCVIIGRSIRLNASGGASYQWEQDPTIIGSTRIPNPEVMPSDPTVYVVTITDSNGCDQVFDVEVCIIEDPASLIKAINVITPNNDGINDDLEFIGLDAFPNNRLVIYNRWGNIIFEKSGYQTDVLRFNGTRGGELLPADTYYYILEFEDVQIKSSLTIIREK
jgi:gliding motility-associated-like protein